MSNVTGSPQGSQNTSPGGANLYIFSSDSLFDVLEGLLLEQVMVVFLHNLTLFQLTFEPEIRDASAGVQHSEVSRRL